MGVKRVARKTAVIASLGTLCLALSACGRGEPTAGGAASNAIASSAPSGPQAQCADAGTYATIKKIVFENAEKAASDENKLILLQVQPQSTVKVDLPVFDGMDAETKKVSCEGRLHIMLPPRNGAPNGDLSESFSYTIQPAADGSGDVVGVTGLVIITASLAGGDLSPWAVHTDAAVSPTQLAPQANVVAPLPPAGSHGAPSPQPAPPMIAQDNTSAPTIIYPTSFNCALAKGYATTTICRDPELASDDVKLAPLYQAAVANDPTGQIRQAARAAWNARQACRDRDCLVRWYADRIAAYQ